MKKLFTLFIAFSFFYTVGEAQEYINENFDSGMPSDWTLESNGSGGAFPWFWNDGTGTQTLNGTGYVRADSDEAGSGFGEMDEMLISPMFDPSGADNVVVEFDQYYNNLATNEIADLEVWNGTEWQIAYSNPNADIGDWDAPDHQSININDFVNPSGDTQIRFHYNDGGGWNWYWAIDNVIIHNLTCPTPDSLNGVASTDGTAQLSWVSSGSAGDYQVEWGLAGFEVGSGTNIDGNYATDPPPITISGLVGGQSYEFYVVDICGFGDASFPSQRFAFPGPPPANDLCQDAISIACDEMVSGNTEAATADGNPEGTLCNGFSTLNGKTVWYSFVGTGLETQVSLCNSDFDTELFIFTGECDTLQCVAVADGNGGNCSSFGPSWLSFGAEDGVNYLIAVASWSPTNDGGNYELTVSCITCSDPADLSVSVNDVSAEVSFNEPVDGVNYIVEYGPAGFAQGTGVIITGVSGVDGPPVTIDNLNPGDTMDVYVTNDCGGGDFSNSLFDTFNLNLLPPPANDLCENAESISCGETAAGNTETATTIGNYDGDFCGTAVSGPTVWYTFIGTGGEVHFSLCGSSFDTRLHVFTGSCDSLICFAGNDDSFGECGNNNSFINEVTEDGVTYYIAVSGFGQNVGDYTLSIECISCPAPLNLSVDVTDISATVSWDEPIAGVTYSYEYGPSGFTPGTGTTITGVDGVDGPPVLIEGLNAGDTMDVYVHNICDVGSLSDTISTTFILNALPAPDNDLCSNATVIGCDETVSGTTAFATSIGNYDGDFCGTSNATAPAVWYQFVGTGQVTEFSLCGSNYDSKLHIFTGSCDSLICFAGNDDGGTANCPSSGANSFILDSTETGVTYYIEVSGFLASTGDYQLSIGCIVCPSITDLSVTVDGLTAMVTWNSENVDAPFTLVWGEAGFDPETEGTTILGVNTDLPVEITGLSLGTVYEVYVSEFCVDQGADTQVEVTTFQTAPSNDDACDAEVLPVSTDVITFNSDATIQDGEVVPPGNGCQVLDGWCNSNLTNTTWYTITPSENMITLTTCFDLSYDTQIALWEVGDCNDFSTYTLVAANDDQIGGCTNAGFASTIEACVIPGQTYYVQVDPYSTFNNGGIFTIRWDEVPFDEEIGEVVTMTDTSATFDWDYVPFAGWDFVLVFGPAGFDPATEGTTVTGDSTDLPVIFEGLDPVTQYEYYLSYNNSCGTVGPVLITTVSINELSFDSNISIYPNPAHQLLTVEINADVDAGTVISLYNIQGQEIYNQSIDHNGKGFRSEIDISNFNPGMYILRIQDDTGSIQKRIIIQ